MSLLGVLKIVIPILIVIILTIGLILCKKNSFKEGFYFFLLLIINQLNSYIAPWYIDHIYEDRLSTWLTYGEAAWFSLLINQLILFTALILLVIGLKRRWY